MWPWIVGGLAVMAGGGVVYQAVMAGRDKQKYPPPGQMVPVDGRRIHMQIKGEANGRPTVILEAGMISFSSNWYWVQEALSGETRVVSYDRAGLGWSDPPPHTQDAYESAADLHAALVAAGIGGPYVLVGHSYGGLVVRAFADKYLDEVAGMVLADASHPDQWAHMPASRNGSVNATGNRMFGLLARLGLVRFLNTERALTQGLPEQPAAEMRASLALPRSWSVSGKTLALWPKKSRFLVNEAQDLGDRPLVVLGVTEQPFYDEVLTNLQSELPALSTNSVRYVVEGASHERLVSEEKNALVVAAAVRAVLASVETGRPVAEEWGGQL